MNKNSRLVYSTETGRIKPEKEKTKHAGSADGIIRVSREKRNGKDVTVCSGFDMDEKQLKALAKSLKQLCGTGGTAKAGKIEIQGDQREKIMAHLDHQGIKNKRAGG